MRITLSFIFYCLLFVVPPVVPVVAQPARFSTLRDISIVPSSDRAVVTLLVKGVVDKVVLEQIGATGMQVRMKSMRSRVGALKSGRLKKGVTSIRARIERRDVLVVDVRFTRKVTALRVARRDAERVELVATLGPTAVGGDSVKTNRVADRFSRKKREWSLTSIVIDPGHGGKDPGATGLGGIVEKDITLSIALTLRKELEKNMPGVKVVMTREDDSFVELFRRGQIANENGGRLFVSIHCNSMPDTLHPAAGFECYILRPEKSGDAALVAATENRAIEFESDRQKYQTMSAEITIMASMAQSAFARYSEQAAHAIRRSMRVNTPLADHGVRQAGFYVLVGASMPGVLLETGYISNRKDARVLASSSGRRKVAKAISRGIAAYEKIYSESLR